ncbi:MAG: hypothetical protein M1442_02130 [Candidatus Thermoplasmatota archaeon]|jgi:hypothetical protein|nr:hypothetical protein [Candidatus Thermoplasmatota archaeon]
MIGFWWLLSLGILLVEVTLLLVILAFYARVHVRTGGRLFLGLELFSGLFIAQDAVGVWAVLSFSSYLGSSVSVPLAAMNAIGLGALISLYLMLRV